MPSQEEKLNQEVLDEAKKLGLDESDFEGEAKMDNEFAPKDETLDSSEPVKPAPKAEEKEEKPAPAEKKQEDESKDPSDQKSKTSEEAFKERKSIRDVRQEIQDLKSLVSKLLEAKTPEKQEEKAEAVQDAFKEFAQKHKEESGEELNPATLKEMFGLFTKQLGITPEKLAEIEKLKPAVAKTSNDLLDRQIEQQFSDEWNSFLPELKKQYPNASEEQITKARAAMHDEAVSEKYGYVEGKHEAYPLDWIFQKESEKFKPVLFSPKKKTGERGHLGDADEVPTNPLEANFDELTPEGAAKLDAELDNVFKR